MREPNRFLTHARRSSPDQPWCNGVAALFFRNRYGVRVSKAQTLDLSFEMLPLVRQTNESILHHLKALLNTVFRTYGTTTPFLVEKLKREARKINKFRGEILT